MDIHRCRFVQYPPQPVNALAFSHPSNQKNKTPQDLRLAVGRSNGDVELWNPQRGLWVQETILRGSRNTTIEQLAWTQDVIVDEDAKASKLSQGPLRLFSTGGSTSITEWDLCRGSVKRRAESNYGDIWCFAAQPQVQDQRLAESLPAGSRSQLLAAGCSDGTIVLFSTEDDDLRYLQTLVTPPVKKPKVLSIAWRDRNTVVAGYEDSTIRVVDLPSRRIIRNMSLGKPADGNNSVVWTVKCLPDGAIISGDSSGELKIWDPKNYSLVQRLKSHRADILDLATSVSGDTIFSMGVDRRTVCYKPVAIHSGSQKMRWAEVFHKRFHQHDVKCSASFESADLSVLVSGAMDARLVVVPIQRGETEYHRRLSHLPQQSRISASTSSRLFISWWDREISVYHVRKYKTPVEHEFSPEPPTEPGYETLARLIMQGDETIQDAKISEDGHFIIAATINSVKLFQLRKTLTNGRECLRTRRIELPLSIGRLGARRIGFSPDGKWLVIVRADNTVVLGKMIISSTNPKDPPVIHAQTAKLHRPVQSSSSSVLSGYRQTITQVAFHQDSRVLAVGDLSGAIDVWVLEGHEDLNFIEAAPETSDNGSNSSASSSTSSDDDDDESPIIHGQKWIRNPAGSRLPQLDSSLLALTFRPSSTVASAADAQGTVNLGIHATRHTPHPVAHELPLSDVRLVAVTATHQLVEFDVLNCRLSEWSRRNPSRLLPFDFSRIKDRVMGSLWDCSDRENKGERLWLYGSTWMLMLDLSQDLSQDNAVPKDARDWDSGVGRFGTLGRYAVVEPASKKQKLLEPPSQDQQRGSTNAERRPKGKTQQRNTGAGDEVPLHKRQSGMGGSIRKFTNTDDDDAEMVDADSGPKSGDNEDRARDSLDEDDGDTDALVAMRRESHAVTASKTTPRPSHWQTFDYHSILGVSVLGVPDTDDQPRASPREEDAETAPVRGNVEVVVVERSMHDVEQTPRFDGGQEWET